jgi:dGTPase
MSAGAGLNLTRRTLLSVMKYPAAFSDVVNTALTPRLLPSTTAISILDRNRSKPPKCYHDAERDTAEWVLRPLTANDRAEFQRVEVEPGKHSRTQHKSFDCSIMDVADEIAYGVHDLEDAIALRLILEEQFRSVVTPTASNDFLKWVDGKRTRGSGSYDKFIGALFGCGSDRKRYISRLVGYFVTSIQLKELESFDEPVLRFRAALPEACNTLLQALTKAVRKFVIKDARVQHLEFKGQQMVVSVFEAFAAEPDALLPDYAFKGYESADHSPRIICDHVAGMTDGFLLKTYERLFSPRMGSVFDQL